MPGERRMRILGLLAAEGPAELETQRLCAVAASTTGMSGAGIVLMSVAVPQGSVWTGGGSGPPVEQMQLDLGEGPCIDAFVQDRPVHGPDLTDPASGRWPAFSRAAVAAGVRAAFALPLHIGAVRLGVLSLHRDRPGSPSTDEHADALVVADVAAQAVLVMQAQAPPEQLAAELVAGGTFPYVVHQASGMVAAQLEVEVGHALVRLRAYAFGHDRPLVEVAEDVVARRLRFSPSAAASD